MVTYIDDLEAIIKELEKENKNLRLIQETNEKQIQNDINERDELREENKKLNLQIAELMWERDWKQMKIEDRNESTR